MRCSTGVLVVLAACSTPAEEGVDSSPPDPVVESPFGPARGCPAYESGDVDIEVDGLVRTVQVELPVDPIGAPVVFVWHWTGGSAGQILDLAGFRSLADEGYIVVAPEASGRFTFEWDFEDASESNVDLGLFDAVLPCLYEQYRVDPRAIYATGHSAGGLMTTFLTMHRSEVLAATAPFSGGASGSDYQPPVAAIRSLVTWGGVSDTFAGYSFHEASLDFVDRLEEDGSFAVACDHGGGHTLPAEAVDMSRMFFDAHRRGESSPWSQGLPAGLPTWCR